MHRSRLTSVLIDVPEDLHSTACAFWSAALGRPLRLDDTDPEYTDLDGLFSGLQVMVQRIGDGAPARVHIDIETDDVEAEVRRLEGLGATRVEAIQTWWVMRDPAGLPFCVVRVQSPAEFESQATRWGDPIPAPD